MKTYRIQLTAEEQKKLDQVLRRLNLKNIKDYAIRKLNADWLSVQ